MLAVTSTDVRDARARARRRPRRQPHRRPRDRGARRADQRAGLRGDGARAARPRRSACSPDPRCRRISPKGSTRRWWSRRAFDEVVAEGRRLLNAPPVLRVYSSKDLAGVELASALVGCVHGRARALRWARDGRRAARRADHARRRRGVAARSSRRARRRGRSPASPGSATCSCARAAIARRTISSGAASPTAWSRPTAARTEGARAAIAGCELAAKLRVRMPLLAGVAAVLAGKLEPQGCGAAHRRYGRGRGVGPCGDRSSRPRSVRARTRRGSRRSRRRPRACRSPCTSARGRSPTR